MRELDNISEFRIRATCNSYFQRTEAYKRTNFLLVSEQLQNRAIAIPHAYEDARIPLAR